MPSETVRQEVIASIQKEAITAVHNLIKETYPDVSGEEIISAAANIFLNSCNSFIDLVPNKLAARGKCLNVIEQILNNLRQED